MFETRAQALELAIKSGASPEGLIEQAEAILKFMEAGKSHRPDDAASEQPLGTQNKS